MEAIRLAAGVLVPEQAFQVKAVRSGGPGGQNVNKVSSKVEVRVDLALIEGLAPDALARLRTRIANRLDADGRWLVTSSRTRDQLANLEDARMKIIEVLEAALVAPVPRRPTRPTRSSKAARLAVKKRDGAIKRDRTRKTWD